MEEWRTVRGTNGHYEISSRGRLRSVPHGRILAPSKSKSGYYHIQLRYGFDKDVLIHRLVAEAFVDNPKDCPVVNHKDEDKENNRADNLEWCTAKYNVNYGHSASLKNSPVLQFDEHGNFLKMWLSMKNASEALDIKYQGISRVCRGLRKTCGGYAWRYVEEFKEMGVT